MVLGVVSVRSNGQVVMKFVAGMNGNKAEQLAEVIRARKTVPFDVNLAYDVARVLGFGSEACLVVMTADAVAFRGEGELSPLYRDKFSDPEFNPRWECGLADHVEVVDF